MEKPDSKEDKNDTLEMQDEMFMKSPIVVKDVNQEEEE